MFARFTDDARRVVVSAQEEARERHHNYIGGEHLLLALVRDEESVAARALLAMGVDSADVVARIDAAIGTGGHAPSGHIPFTPSAKKVLEHALREALQLEDTFIGTEHILLGIVREGEGVAASVLTTCAVDLDRARATVVLVRGDKRAVARGRRRSSATAGMLQTWARPPSMPVPRCVLCGRDREHCERILVSRGVWLCSDCALGAVALLDALPDDAPKLVRYQRPEVAPEDKDAAVAAIERAFDAVFSPMSLPDDEALAYIEGGEEAREMLAEMRSGVDRSPFLPSDQAVERVRFVDEAEAEVTLGIWMPGNAQPTLVPVHAVREGGTWKVARSTLDHFASLARQYRPPPPP